MTGKQGSLGRVKRRGGKQNLKTHIENGFGTRDRIDAQSQTLGGGGVPTKGKRA